MNNRDLSKIIISGVRGYLNEAVDEYPIWKRANVTLRGIKNLGKHNGNYGSFGKGLYMVPLGNKSMTAEYGDRYFVVNGKPKNPIVVNTLNDAELLRQNLINDFCKKHGRDYDPGFFEKNTGIETEILNQGRDGLVIKGREIVNYAPAGVKYFKTEAELRRYYEELRK